MEENEKSKNEKSSKWKNIVIILLVVLVLVLVAVLAYKLGQDSKDNDKDDEIIDVKDPDDNPEENNDKEVDNTISQELRKDLDKKVDLNAHFVGTGIYTGNIKNIVAENTDVYDYLAYITYQYYIYKTGTTIDKWSTSDSSYGQCYKNSQNGYCYPIDKTSILQYEKELYNIGEDVFDVVDGYSIVKGNKVYVTDVPWNDSLKVEQKNVVSVVKNNDVIEYTATYAVGTYDVNETQNMTIKYLFKANEDGNYYLYSFEKV